MAERSSQPCSTGVYGLGYRQMVAVIGGSDTWPSIRLHAALGFIRVGTLPAVGFKFGKWVDIVIMQRALGLGETPAPAEISSINGEKDYERRVS